MTGKCWEDVLLRRGQSVGSDIKCIRVVKGHPHLPGGFVFYLSVCLSIYLSIFFCFISSECRPGYKKATKDDDHLATHEIKTLCKKYVKKSVKY